MSKDRNGRGERRHVGAAFSFEGRGFRGHGHGGGQGGRLGRRVFDHGDLRYVLLQLIAEKPGHGYELIKAIEERFSGKYSPSPGVIYPTLTLLEELGYLRSQTDGSKKLYSITEEGATFLDANRPLVDAIVARMAEMSRTLAGSAAPEIRRAMHNLEHSLSIRLAKGPLDPEQVRTITEALDRTATEIERS